MDYLVDTNVLLRLATPTDPWHETAKSAVQKLKERGQNLSATGQNFIEAWSVITRPIDRNGLGQTPDVADRILQHLEEAFPRLTEPPEVYLHWRELVAHFRVSGVQVHDTRLVAVMLTTGVETILTFNTADFRRYAEVGIRPVEPRTI